MSATANRALVVLQGGAALPLNALQTFIIEQGIDPAAADITSDPASLGSSSTYSRAAVIATSADAGLLGAVAKHLQPGSSLALQLHGQVCVWQRLAPAAHAWSSSRRAAHRSWSPAARRATPAVRCC